MADDHEQDTDEQGPDTTETDDESDSQSFRDRVEEIRDAGSGEDDEGERPENPFGGGAGMGGGNPMAQMMGGMMGGGPGGMGGGPGGPPGAQSEGGSEELVHETRKLRDEVHDVRRELERIADTLEDD